MLLELMPGAHDLTPSFVEHDPASDAVLPSWACAQSFGQGGGRMRGSSSASAGCQDRPRDRRLLVSQHASQHATAQLLGHSPRWQRGNANALKCHRAQHLSRFGHRLWRGVELARRHDDISLSSALSRTGLGYVKTR